MYDLPSEDPEDPGLPDEFHDLQPQLLSRTLRLGDYNRENYFTVSDLNLYYDVRHPLWHKRPGWFLVVDVPRLYEGTDLRRSYVIWQEGHSPYIIVEFLSPGTEVEDLGRFYDKASRVPAPETEQGKGGEPEKSDSGVLVENGLTTKTARLKRTNPPAKFEVYEQYLRVPHYIVYSRYTQRLRYFKLHGGHYQEQSLHPDNPQIWIDDLKIGLGVWDGVFEGIPSHWLRWCDREGTWFLTDTEQERLEKEQERLEKEQKRLEKEQAQAQLKQAAQNLLATGMAISQVAEILGLSESQVQTFCEM